MSRQTNKKDQESHVPVDDQINSVADVLFDVFYFGDEFSHHQITTSKQELVIAGNELVYDGEMFFLNRQPFKNNQRQFVIKKPMEYQTMVTNKPKKDFLISMKASSAISLATSAFIYVSVNPQSQGFSIDIYGNKERVYFNHQPVEKGFFAFNVGDYLVINRLIIEVREQQLKLTDLGANVVLNPFELVEERYEPEYPAEFPLFRRSPRIQLKEPQVKLEVLAPKPAESEGRNELLRTVVPPLGMVVLSGATSFLSGGNPIMMLSMGGASLLTAGFSVSSYFTNKKDIKSKNQKRTRAYKQYLIQKKGELARLQQEQKQVLTYMYPPMNDLALMAKGYHARVYERMTTNEDFLKIYIGTGEIQASFSVNYQPNDESELNAIAEKQVVWQYQQLPEAPIVIPLMGQTIGLAGNYPVLRTAIQTLLFQLSVLHSYRDVEFVALIPEEDYATHWHEWRWLPHLKLRNLNLRGMIHNAQTREMVLNSFYQIVTKRKQELREAGNERIKFHPHYVFVILEEAWLAGHGLNEFLSEDMSPYGITVIWGKDALPMLPETTTTLIDYRSSESAVLINQNNEYINQQFVPTHLPSAYPIEAAIQRLANLHHVEVEKNAIPETVAFLELYGVQTVDELDIEARWQQADTSKSLAVPLGMRGKEDLVYLNLHERAHGPHGLVAGTTGSGKSEIVQSYILSLAVNFAPEDVGFLPIDFKGGGMANLFMKLPHLLGSITNLDGASSARALQSIRAELQKRQRYFNQFGVNHINGYTKLYKQGKALKDLQEQQKYPTTPLPHLFLISDEFAELKANEPEFMAELVSIARIGRSLGVHLILATQKPSGVVDDQIWSNSRFKLALKVADANDSNEIIKTPDAATITQPGRAYLQVGNNEIYELFQSAWSGAGYHPATSEEEKIDERIWLINQLGQFELLTADLSQGATVRKKGQEPTQLEAVIDVIQSYSEKTQAVLPEKPWLPPLAVALDSPVTAKDWGATRRLKVPFAFMDIPSQQAQVVFDFDFQELAHTAIYGSPGFGKSTALQTLVMNLARLNTPDQVQFNLFDFGTNGLLPLKNLPHVADLVRLEEEEKLEKFLKRIRQEIQQRKDAFMEYGVASLAQYEEKSGKQLPVMVTILDGFDAVKESPLEEAIESVVNQILREGGSLGIYIVISVLRTTTFRMSMASNIPSHIGLFLVEEGAIKDVVGRDALLPQEIIGRGQIKLEEPYEFQIYLPSKGENDLERLTNLEAEIDMLDREWQGERPEGIPMLNKVISMTDFYDLSDVQKMLNQLALPLALDKESTNVVSFIPKEHGYLVLGEDTPQQAEYLEKIMVENLKHFAGQAKRVVFNGSERFSSNQESFDLMVAESEYSTFVNELVSEIELRQQAEAHQPMFVYIPEAHLFGEKALISNEAIDVYLRKAAKVSVYFIFQGNQRQFENSFDDVNKRLRSNIPAGVIGTRMVDQGLVPTKASYNEAPVGIDEAHFFVGRNSCRVKLVSE